ncbi:MAG: BamA/TamA family outer membrane protein, partial [Fimbriimonadales bacterium]|nr:BamA/TamA family outer membrane protein [Fimbriimonadales bacterium]
AGGGTLMFRSARYGMATLLLLTTLLLGLAQERRVESVTIRGLRNISETAVTAALRLKPGEPFTEANLEADRRAIEGMGLFSAVRPSVEQTETGVRVAFDVVENPLIREVRFTGNTVVSSEQLLEVIRNKPGFVFNNNLAEPDIRAIRDAYQRAGYIVLPEGYIPPNYETGVLTIALSELRVGQIKVDGNTKTRTNVILRELRTKPSELFNIPRWQRDLNRLYNTGYFDQITPEEEPVAPGVIDITLRVKERPTGRLNVGFAIDSHRRLIGLAEIFETNFQGTGRTVGVNFQSTGGRNGNSIELLFTEPYLDRHRTTLSVSLYNKLIYRFTSNFFGGGQIDPNLEQRYDERRRGVTVGVSRPLNDFLTASVGLRTEDVNTNRVATSQGGGFIRQDGSLTSLTLRGVYNNRDFDLDPAQGQYLALTLEPGITNVRSAEQQFLDSGVVRLGRSNFLRGSVDYRLYYSPEGRRTQPDEQRQVFAIRAYYGTVSGSVPFFEQFFIGGAETLRGYSEDRFWGKNAALLSLEYRRPIEKAFTAVFFVDIGHAWGGYPSVNEFTQSRAFQPQVGYGLGIRVRTPLGPLRIDYGIGREGGRTHFSVGQVF